MTVDKFENILIYNLCIYIYTCIYTYVYIYIYIYIYIYSAQRK